MARILSARHWKSTDTVALARHLLGKALVRRLDDGAVVRQWITEVEAYDGEEDLACHASKGRTPRTSVMYAPGGCWYVYLCYGVHELLNLVTGPEGRPAAVLIRGLAGISGPGRLTRALAIDRRFNAQPAARTSGLWIEDHGICIPDTTILATPRIGVDYAGPVWSQMPWRFVINPAALP